MPMYDHDIPDDRKRFTTLAPADAGDTSETHVIFIAPFRCFLTDVDVYPCAAIVGDDTDRFNLNLHTDEEIGNYDFDTDSGTSTGSAALEVLDGAEIEMDEGDVLSLQRETVGSTGLAMPPMGVEITFRGR